MKHFITLTLCVIALAGLDRPHAAWAEALYQAGPEATAAHVRFIGFPADTPLTWQGQTIAAPQLGGMYTPIQADVIDEAPGAYITVALLADGRQQRFVEPEQNPRQVALSVMNLSEKPLDVTAGDGSIAVFTDVAAQTFDQRLTNPVQVPLQVRQGDDILADISVSLARGTRPLLLIGADGQVRLITSAIPSAQQ